MQGRYVVDCVDNDYVMSGYATREEAQAAADVQNNPTERFACTNKHVVRVQAWQFGEWHTLEGVEA